jgi:hypothetical protein
MSKNLFLLGLVSVTFAITTFTNVASSKANFVDFNSYSYTAETNFTDTESSPEGEDVAVGQPFVV